MELGIRQDPAVYPTVLDRLRPSVSIPCGQIWVDRAGTGQGSLAVLKREAGLEVRRYAGAGRHARSQCQCFGARKNLAMRGDDLLRPGQRMLPYAQHRPPIGTQAAGYPSVTPTVGFHLPFPKRDVARRRPVAPRATVPEAPVDEHGQLVSRERESPDARPRDSGVANR